MQIWPRSLAARTAMVLVTGLTVIQVAGLTIHALDRVDLQRVAQEREIAVRAMSLYRSVALSAPADREAVAREFDRGDDTTVQLEKSPPIEDLPPAPPPLQRQMRADMTLVPLPAAQQPRDTMVLGGPAWSRMIVGLRLPDGDWITVSMPMPPPRPWHSTSFLVAFVGMSVAAGGLTLWAVRRLIAPIATLAAAAEQLGRDVNAPPLPETGATELATAAVAFNTMAERIRRFVQDRTFMLTAIGHDLRTPITRLKLRAEFIEDEEQRHKTMADLDELEAMVSATLAFGRDVTTNEPLTAVDLAQLARTVLDECGDARPGQAHLMRYDGPDHVSARVRPIAIKRALTNLVTNALAYGGNVRLTLLPPDQGIAIVLVEDDGPGIPPGEFDRVFQPFHRGEASRNRETGGVGLGLPIARNILRAHGGDVALANRPMGGLRATLTLPV
jgi:signal transduction histidine kinase